MNNIVIDVETVPADTFMCGEVMAAIKPPANISKPQTIKKWWDEKGEQARTEAVHALGLNPLWGKIVCVCFKLNDNPVRGFMGSEHTILTALSAALEEELDPTSCPVQARWVGHNLHAFDLPFLRYRYMLHGLKLPVTFPKASVRPWDTQTIFDTRVCLSGGKPTGMSLDHVRRSLGIPSSMPEVNGSQVWDMYERGQFAEIIDYCMDDVNITSELFEKLRWYYGN